MQTDVKNGHNDDWTKKAYFSWGLEFCEKPTRQKPAKKGVFEETLAVDVVMCTYIIF